MRACVPACLPVRMPACLCDCVRGWDGSIACFRTLGPLGLHKYGRGWWLCTLSACVGLIARDLEAVSRQEVKEATASDSRPCLTKLRKLMGSKQKLITHSDLCTRSPQFCESGVAWLRLIWCINVHQQIVMLLHMFYPSYIVHQLV